MLPTAARALTLGGLSALIFFTACGETRRPIGAECLRNEDCLSSTCAARTCAAEPGLVTGATNPPGEEEPRIPDGGAPPVTPEAGAPTDAKSDG